MSNEQDYEGEISGEEENAYYAAQAQMDAAIQEQADQDYHESQMDEQAQEEYDRQTFEFIEQLKKRMGQSFEGFPKIARLSREIVITEKIDGTNAQILINEDGTIVAGSRTRFITPENDNYGFAKWVKENEEELKKLGFGRHFGEWWGNGCQRGYGLSKGDKRFSLFNTSRWNSENIPSCCYVVPELYRGDFDTNEIEKVLYQLKNYGSIASPNFMNPEGIIIYHTAAGVGFKKTIHNDDAPKNKVK